MQPEHLNLDEVEAEILMMMIAAPDTTSALICSLVNNILQNKHVYDSLMCEIQELERGGFLSSPIVSYEDVKSMTYLLACIDETSRIAPSVPVVLPRRVSKGGTILSGYFIPEGAEIGTSAPVINNNETIFGPQTNEFQPERWLGKSDKIVAMKRCLFSWGWGSRKCVAKNMSLMQTMKFTAQVCP